MLRDDFESSDQEIRLKALKRVKLVADVLGPEVTRSELIPFIDGVYSDYVVPIFSLFQLTVSWREGVG